MRSVQKIASIVFALGHAICIEDKYSILDSDLAYGDKGFLYNIGSGRYLGRSNDGQRIVGVEDPKTALMFTINLDTAAKVAKIIFLSAVKSDVDSRVPPTSSFCASVGVGCQFMGYPSLTGLRPVPDDAPIYYGLDFYDSRPSQLFYATLPVLKPLGAFKITQFARCLAVLADDNFNLVDNFCHEDTIPERNRELFVWVPANKFNLGIWPDSNQDSPYVAIAEAPTIEELSMATLP